MSKALHRSRLTLRLGLAVFVAAWSIACQAPARGAPPVLVDGRRITPGTDTMYITEIAGGREQAAGTAISTVRQLPADQLELRYARVRGGSSSTVIARMNRADLRPIEEVHDFGGGDVLRLRYTTVGVVTERRSPRGPDETSSPDPAGRDAFSSAVADLVLRALPLARGFRAELPVYIMALGRRASLPVRVAGDDVVTTLNGRRVDCWRVEADFPGPATEQFWISKESRQLMRVMGHLSPSTLERYER